MAVRDKLAILPAAIAIKQLADMEIGEMVIWPTPHGAGLERAAGRVDGGNSKGGKARPVYPYE